MLYDSLLVMGVLALSSGLLVVPFTGKALLIPAELGGWAYALRVVQVLLIVLFFGYFWTQRGQTIGMLAWRLRIARNDGRLPSWPDALKRQAVLGVLLLPFFLGNWLVWGDWSDRSLRSVAIYASLAPLAACYLWIWIDRERRSWHDRISGTRLWLAPKRVRT